MNKRNRILAALLALIGGVFGIHKFYLQRTFAGTVYVLLFIMGINIFNFPVSVILGFFDAIKLLGMSDEMFDQKYNKDFLKNAASNRSQNYKRRGLKIRERTQTHARGSGKTLTKKANPYKSSGIQKYKDYDLEAAIQDFHKSLEIEPNDPAMFFNLACAYSLTEQKSKCLEYLELAVKSGFNDYERILSHEDLAYIRIQPEFEEFRNKITDPLKIRDQHNKGLKLESNDKSQKDDTLLEQLNKLTELRNRGLINDAEFAIERRKLLRE